MPVSVDALLAKARTLPIASGSLAGTGLKLSELDSHTGELAKSAKLRGQSTAVTLQKHYAQILLAAEALSALLPVDASLEPPPRALERQLVPLAAAPEPACQQKRIPRVTVIETVHHASELKTEFESATRRHFRDLIAGAMPLVRTLAWIPVLVRVMFWATILLTVLVILARPGIIVSFGSAALSLVPAYVRFFVDSLAVQAEAELRQFIYGLAPSAGQLPIPPEQGQQTSAFAALPAVLMGLAIWSQRVGVGG